VIPGSKEVPGGAASAAEALEHMELGLDDLEGAVEALKGSIGSIEEEASAVARAGAEVNAHARRMTEELMRNASAAREAMEVMERASRSAPRSGRTPSAAGACWTRPIGRSWPWSPPPRGWRTPFSG